MTRIRSIVAILSIALLLTMGSSTAQIQVFDRRITRRTCRPQPIR